MMWAILAVLLALCLGAAGAREAVPNSDNPRVQERLIRLSEELRCLVCQNQSLADSHSGLAEDLRREISGMLDRGRSDAEIVDYMVERYGDFVMYRPPFRATTVILWLGPFALLVAGLAVLASVLRRRSGAADETMPAQAGDDQEEVQ